MGRLPPKVRNRSDSMEKKTSKSELNGNVTKKKNKHRFYKNKFKSYIGSSKEGHGFASIQKKRLLSKFRRKFKRKKDQTNSQSTMSIFETPRQVADDTAQSNSTMEDSTLTGDNSTVIHDSMNSTSNTQHKKKSTKNLKRIEIDYQAIQEERKKKLEELQASMVEREHVVVKNIEERKKITKRLSKRTKRGQPVMANQIHHILDKIKSGGPS